MFSISKQVFEGFYFFVSPRAKVSCEPGSSSDPILSSIELIRDDKKNVCLDKMELLGKVYNSVNILCFQK